MTDISGDNWRMMMLNLVQAMLGAISSNVRMVSLSCDRGVWVFSFILEKEDSEDREEINDILCEIEALQDAPIDYRVNVLVYDGVIDWPDPSVRVVYRRKE